MHAFMITGVKIDVYQHTFMHAYMDTHTQIPGGNRDMFGINNYMSGS